MFGFGRELSFVGKTSPCPHDRHSTWVSCSQPAEIARISCATTAVIAIRSRCERVSVAITTIFPRPVEHIDRYQVQEVGDRSRILDCYIQTYSAYYDPTRPGWGHQDDGAATAPSGLALHRSGLNSSPSRDPCDAPWALPIALGTCESLCLACGLPQPYGGRASGGYGSRRKGG